MNKIPDTYSPMILIKACFSLLQKGKQFTHYCCIKPWKTSLVSRILDMNGFT